MTIACIGAIDIGVDIFMLTRSLGEVFYVQSGVVLLNSVPTGLARPCVLQIHENIIDDSFRYNVFTCELVHGG